MAYQAIGVAINAARITSFRNSFDNIAVGVTSVLTTVLGIWLLGYVGRRKMLIIGFSGVAGSQALLAIVFMLPPSDAVSYIILAAMMLFVAFVQCFIGTCVWLLLSEIFPLAIRGFAMGIAVFALWTVNAGISFAFPIINESLGSTGTFGLFVVINLISLGFVSKFVPETKGRSLEELEADFRGLGAIQVPVRTN
jgi:major inositol transporter-like SP family MFS transporter